MNNETVRSLSKIRNLASQQNQFKRYMKVAEACRNYQLDRRIITEIAIECGALYKIHTITLIDMNAFEPYFEKKFKVAE
jgi:hypothetical protein